MPRRIGSPSRPATDALRLLGSQIAAARRRRGWTQAATAARLGVDPRTVSAIERGSPAASIGTVFSAAFLCGVNLFGLEGDDLARARRQGEETLALLPERIRRPRGALSDGDTDF